MKNNLLAMLLLTSAAVAQIPANHIRIHYSRLDGNYSGWTVYAFEGTTEDTGNYGGGPVQVSGTDSYGAYFDVGVTNNAQSVGVIIHNPTHAGGDVKDPGPNEFVNPSAQGNEFWAVSGVNALYTTQPVPSQQPAKLLPGYARIHYFRPDHNYSNWSVYSFNDTEEPTNNFNDGPVFQTGSDSYGAFFDIKLKNNPNDLGFIVHNPNTNTKDPGPDMHLNVATYKEAWVISGDTTVYTSVPTPAQILQSGFSRLQTFWIDRSTIAVPSQYIQKGSALSLVYSYTAGLQITSSAAFAGGGAIPLTPSSSGLTSSQLQQFPQLSGYSVFKLPATIDLATLAKVLKSELVVAAADGSGALKYVTGVQIAGVLDDLFYYNGHLGAVFSHRGLSVNVWAPTAQSMKLLLYHGASDAAPAAIIPMTEKNGVWSAPVDRGWNGKFYLLDLFVYVPSLHQIVENIVTDPYSVDLALNGAKTRLTDLDSESTKPDDWDEHRSPHLNSLNDISLYELHVRDFSAADASVPTALRGTYLAFAQRNSNGMRHLSELAEAGLKAVHLLPTFHIASINEDKSTWQYPSSDLSQDAPDSTAQQAAITAIQDTDPYNWGYDPVHYMAPEGSYAHDPNQRVREYREMVMGLHRAGLRVVQDVVFNHTSSSGQAANSVLDKVVPSYYYRLNADGIVENGSCCSDTASEHRMMEKLMIDTLVNNTRQYKIDGYRFDLMSFHFTYNLQHIQQALAQLTPEKDGVDGSKIYLYGEGWNFGETGNNQLGPNASQVNMYGFGIGTFNDRVRDGIRGGSPFSDERAQGFATGMYTAANAYTSQSTSHADQLNALLANADWIRAGLAGNLRDFTFTDGAGQTVKASQIDYGGQPVGYTASPIEDINYCSAHDNQTIFDAIQLKSAAAETIAQRARRQMVALSLIALGQGVPFFHAGDDLLRSKDMDNNSYNSGDWFNEIDFSFQTNGWGRGLPKASENQSNWGIMQPLLANPALKATPANIDLSRRVFQEFLAIRYSSPLFRMTTLADVQANLHFLNTGPQQTPGVIVMTLANKILVVFNATANAVTFQDNSLKGWKLRLHPVQARSADAIVRKATFDTVSGAASVPALTTAVWRID